MKILGISAYFHDAAAALLIDGTIVAAAHEERFTRRKHDDSFPENAIRYVLSEYDLKPSDLDAIVFYDKPLLKFERILEIYHRYAPRGVASFVRAMSIWVKEKLFIRHTLLKELEKIEGKKFLKKPRLLFPEHHVSHAASAFYPSPFEDAAILTVDGVGEWATTTIGHGHGKEITMLKEMHFPHSLGLLYSAFTYYCGFKINDGEYKLMGLAPYGHHGSLPSATTLGFSKTVNRQENLGGSARVKEYKKKILDELIELKDDGSFFLNMSYFTFATSLRTVDDKKWTKLFGIPPRTSDRELTSEYMDLALAIQEVTEEVLICQVHTAKELTGARNIVLAGGVALNCVANEKILNSHIFERMWIQPAAGDAGGAIGAALVAHYLYFGGERILDKDVFDSMQGSYLGPSFSDEESRRALRKFGASFTQFDSAEKLYTCTAHLLNEGKIVGWMQGRAEWGPRALGNRSILSDARSPFMQKKLNLKIKYREGFRPFAPAVLEEDAGEYFEIEHVLKPVHTGALGRNSQQQVASRFLHELPWEGNSPYMLFTAPVKKERRLPTRDGGTMQERLGRVRSDIPAVTHLDYSARVQTVSRKTNERFWSLLDAFKKETGYGLLINTSFNVRDEPIVLTPADAYRCFMKTEMDALVIGNILLLKSEQRKGESVKASNSDDMIPAPLLNCLKVPNKIHSSNAKVVRVQGAFVSAEGISYADQDGVPSLLTGIESEETDPVTGKIKAFYEENPFPNYDGVQNFGDLVLRGEKNPFAKGLLDSIGFNKLILECGCGTGQLSHFLSLNNNHVLGIDLSLSSLKLAVEHKKKNEVSRAGFVQMNIFDLGIQDGTFDVVISTGVLHHTRDARAAFAEIVRKAKPGGLVVVGLYNSYARIPTWIRSKLIKFLGPRIDYVVRNRIRDRRKADIWVKDQYYNPHETWHSLGEVLSWFEENNVSYLNSYPAIMGTHGSKTGGNLFEETSPGGSIARAATQLSWLGSIASEGALFVVTGRRRE